MVRLRSCLLVVLILGATVFANPVHAQTAPGSQRCEAWVARLISWQGSLVVRRPGMPGVLSASLQQNFCVGDVLEVGAFSRAALELPDQTVVSVDQGTIISFAAPADDKRTWLDILKGAIHVISRDPRALRVITPFANAGIEGTEFFVGVSGDATTVIVYEGSVKVENSAGTATAASGESVLARAGSPPVLQQIVRPRDAVVWTLYYPPTGTGPLPGAAAAEPAVPSVDFYVGRAEQRLAVGRFTEAETDLNKALALAPGDAEVLARQAVIALTRNDAAGAAALADQAVATAPASVAAHLAQSYVRQSAADLPGAIATLEAAAAASPGNALLLARLAELHLSTGDVDRSEASARAAVAADPGLALAQTILGFVQLTRVQLSASISSFETAIGLEPAMPLPRLGLGLARIRGGDLAAGRAELETAVILDPGNSLIRSYMGKAYYEEKRGALAASQLELAKQLDTNDPTPWFYDAIRKQTINDLAGALDDLQTSIERNDNRMVYRSRLQLDEDLAARSAGRGRVYRDLGFNELVLREAWTSIAADPDEYSGHRLLTDSYSLRPRTEIARVNELQKSQLLQPLNMTPVRPQLGESNVLVYDAVGPSHAAYNEYNSLFSRNGMRSQGSALVGGNGTFGVDAVVGLVEDNWSFSLGGFHFETDGFRENNDVDQDVANLLAQYRVAPDTTVLAEARLTRRDQGDLPLYFDPTIFSGDLRSSEDTESLRFGLRHELTSRSELLVQATYQWVDTDAAFGTFFARDTSSEGWSAELQYILRGEWWRVAAGARYRDYDTDATTTTNIPLPDPPYVMSFSDVSSTSSDLKNAYIYGDFDVTDELTITLGLSTDDLKAIGVDEHQVNPKAGLRWVPGDSTVVRAGYFTTLREFAYSRQDIASSLEPTQIAGFTQFFADTRATDASRYGIGLDHRFSNRLFVGVELSRRNMDIPFLEMQGPPDYEFLTVTKSAESNEARTWLYYLLNDNLATSLGYQYQRETRDMPGIPDNLVSVNTHRVPIGIRWFHQSGFGAGMTATWLDQSGHFLDAGFTEYRGDERFWIVDAGLTYRLPNRWGQVGLEIRNLFDRNNWFQDVDVENRQYLPERVVSLRVTFAL
ncbi:MAG: FecR domain-containing protein [Gammaproteobacteria bacterium]